MDQSELQPRFAIIASTQKLTDRFLYTGSLPSEGSSPLSLLYSIEVTRAWFPSSKLIPTITAVLGERFSTIQRSSNPLKSFEATIKNINEELYALAEQGETEWIGHLNALLALVDNNEVHISQTGTSTAYLFRQRRISQVTEASETEAEPHPLNTFSNIISGQLIEGDRIVLSNQDLFALVSLDHIRTAVTDQSPYVAATQISRSVKRTKVTSVSSIIVAIEKSSTWQEAGDEPLVINLEESLQGWHKTAWKKIKPVVIKAGELSKKAWHYTKTGLAKAHQRWKEDYGPKTNQLLRKSAGSISKQVDQLANKIGSKSGEKSAGKVQLAKPLAQADTSIARWISPYRQRLAPVKKALKQADRQIGKVSQQIQPFLTGKNTKRVMIGLAVVLLVWSGVSIRNRHNARVVNENQTANDQVLSHAQELAGKTDVAIQLNQNVEAERLIAEIQQQLTTLADPSDTQQQQRDSLLNAVREKGDKLTNTRRVAANTTYKVPGGTDMIVATDKGIFTLSTGSNTGRYIARDLSQSELEFNLEQGDDKPVSATYDREKDEVFVLTATKRIFGVRLENEAITVRKLENPLGDFADSQIVATFGENLYLLNPKEGLLWKYSPSGDNFSKGVNQIDPAHVALQGTTGMTIDGYIYVLHPDGQVDKLLRGEKASDFAVKNVPESNHQADYTAITTAADVDLIYLFDQDNSKTKSSRVVMINKDGTYSSQLAFNEQLNDIKSFTLDEVNKRLWVLAGTEIFEYKF